MAIWSIITIYETYEMDGGGRGDRVGTIGYFSKQSLAEDARGPRQSANYAFTKVREANVLRVFDPTTKVFDHFLVESEKPLDVDNVRADAKKALKEKALGKLTPEERAALGF